MLAKKSRGASNVRNKAALCGYGLQKNYLVGFFLCINSISLLMGSAYAAPNAAEGIILNNTRAFYNQEGKGGAGYTLTNNMGEPYLLQSQIVQLEKQNTTASDAQPSKVPFIVLPPLQLFKGGETLTVRVRLVDSSSLPTDRESVLGLSLKAIPSKTVNSKDETEQSSTLTFALTNVLKLYYRPAGIEKLTYEQINDKLQFTLQGKDIVASNPTPYYITFNSLSMGGNKVKDDILYEMIPPFSQKRYPTTLTNNIEVTWSLINEIGMSISQKQLKLN